MFIRIRELLKRMLVKLKNSCKRFPEALLVSTAMVITAILLNHIGYSNAREPRKTYENLLMVFSLGLPLFVSIKLFVERLNLANKIRAVIDVTAAAVLIGYYFIIPKENDPAFLFRFAMLNISLYLLFLLVPYFYKRRNYSVYVIYLITKFFVTYLYSFVLYLGIAAIIFTVKKLFDLPISSRIYADILFIVAGLFGITYFLGNVPSYERQLETEHFPKVFRTLFLYIVLPLLTAYTAILYAYFIKILITWQWPKNLVGNLVLWYGIISTAVLFFIYVLQNESKWARQFVRFFPSFIIIPLIIMFWAIEMRASQYGITVPRYCVIAAGIWVLGNMLYHIVSRSYKPILVVFTAVIVLLVSAYGPINAYSVSIWDQNSRFEALLSQYGMLKGNEIVKPAKALTEQQKKAITQSVQYFSSQHKLSDVKVLPKGFTLDKMKEVFGFEYDYQMVPNEYMNYYFDRNLTLIDISSYDYMLDFNGSLNSPDFDLNYQSGNVRASYTGQTNQFDVMQNGVPLYTVNMRDIVNQYQSKRQGRQPETLSDIMITDQKGRVSVTFLIFNLNGQKSGDTTMIGEYMEARILIKIK